MSLSHLRMMMSIHRVRVLSAVLGVLSCTPVTLCAQQAPEGQRYEINDIRFEGNTTLTGSQLMRQMSSKETPGFMNKFLHSISEQIGDVRAM